MGLKKGQKVHRQKSYNYTDKHDKVQELIKSGEPLENTHQLILKVGYKGDNNNIRKSISEMLVEQNIDVEATNTLMEIMKAGKIESNKVTTAKTLLELTNSFTKHVDVTTKGEKLSITSLLQDIDGRTASLPGAETKTE